MMRRRSIRLLALGAMLGAVVAGSSMAQHDHGGHGHGEHGAAQQAPDTHAQPAEQASAAGEIRIEVKGGYEVGPGELKKGQPALLRFVRNDSSECSREVVFPSLGLKKELNVGETVIEVTPEKAGVLKFTCGMDMMKGEIPVAK